MGGWLMWGLILPLLLVVAGIVTIQRRKHPNRGQSSRGTKRR